MRYSLQDVFSVTIFCLPRRLQDVLKTSSRRLGRQKIVMLKTCWRSLEGMSWRRLQDVFKTSKCLLGRWKVFWLLIFNSWFSNLIVMIHILLLINKNLMVPFDGWYSRLQSHSQGTVYFLSQCPQDVLLLIWSTWEEWNAELTLEPNRVLNPGLLTFLTLHLRKDISESMHFKT